MDTSGKKSLKNVQNPTHRPQKFFIQLANSFLWASKISKYFQYSFLWVSNIQHILILIWAQLSLDSSVQQNTISLTLIKICKTLLMKDLISSGENPLMILVYLYFLILFAMMFILFYKLVRRKSVVSQTGRHLNFLFSQFHLSFAFWNISILLLDALLANQDSKATMFGLSFDSPSFMAINIILLVSNLIISLFISLNSYDPLKDSNELSMHTPSFQVFTFLSKGIVVGILTLKLENDIMFLVCTIFITGLLLIRHINFIQTFPYYEFSPLSLSLAFSSTSLSISGLSCFSLIVKSFTALNGVNIVFSECVIAIFLIRIHKSFLKKSIQMLLIQNDSQMGSESFVLKKVFALNYLMKSTKVSISNTENHDIKNLQLWGIWSSLPGKNSEKIDIQTYTSLGADTRPSCGNRVIEAKIYQLLRVTAQNMKSSDKLRIYLANYIAQQNFNLLMGFNYLQQVMKHGYFSKVIASRILEIYQQKINESFGDVMDVKAFLEFEAMSTSFIEMINSNSLRYIEFWKTYNKPNLVMMELLRRSQEIEKEDTVIKDYWGNFKQNNIFYSSSLRLIYSSYLSIVRNAPYSALKLQQTAKFDYSDNKDILKENIVLNVDTLVSSHHVVLHVAMSKEKVGTVNNISRNISEKLGWEKKELLGENINTFIPQFVKDKHSRMLVEQFDRDSQSVSYSKHVDSFVRDKAGNMLPCQIYICFHPNLQQELMYLAILRVKSTFREQVVLSREGFVQGFTRNIGDKLGLITNERKNIREICVNYPTLTFLNERRRYTIETCLSEHNINSLTMNGGKEDVFLRIKTHNQTVNQFSVSVLPQKYFEEDYYILIFNSSGFKLRNSVKRLVISNNIIAKAKSPKAQQQQPDFQEYERRRDSNLLKIFEADKEKEEEEEEDSDDESEDEDEEQFDIPSEAQARGKELDTGLPLGSPTSTSPLKLENQETPIQNDAADAAEVKTEETPETPKVNNFSSKFEKPTTLTRKSSKTNLLKKVNKSHDQESVSSISSKISSNSLKVEKAVYFTPNDYRMKLLTTLFTLLIILTASFLLVFQFQNKQVMQNVTENVMIVGDSVSRIIRIINLYGICLYFPLLDAQIVSDNRFAFLGILSLRAASFVRIAATGSELMSYSTKVRQLTSNLDERLRQSLYTKFPVTDYYQTGEASSTRQLNSFELIIELEVAIKRLGSLKPIQIRGNNTRISFMLDNCLDQLLVNCEEGINVIIQDTQVKFGDLNDIVTALTYIICMLSFFLWGYSIYMVKIFIDHRQNMLNVFRRLDEKEIMMHINSVQKFSSLLVKYDLDAKTIASKLNQKATDFESSLAKPSYIQREKPANMKGIDIPIIKILVYLWLIILLILFGYVVLIVVMKKQNVSISKKIDLMVHANYGLYYTYLRHVAINTYVFQNENMTLRSRPFTEEFDRITAYLAEMDSIYLKVIDKDEGFGEDPRLMELFRGNLCLVAATPLAISTGVTCRLLGGLASKGLITLVTFYRNLIENMKRSFDSSLKTRQDISRILNDQQFIEAQAVVNGFLLNAYDMVNTYMQEQLSKNASKSTNTVRFLVIGIVVAYISFVMFSWWKTRELFMEEKARWRKIFRLVPGPLVKSNKLLEAYLFSHSKGGKTYFE